MKKTIAIAAMLLMAIGSFAQNGKSIYNKYSDAKDVSAVYISPSMFKMIGKIPDMEIGDEDMNLTPVIKSLTGLYLINSENRSINADIKSDVESFVKSGKYEMVMEVKENGETVHIYTAAKDDIINSFVLMSYENGECTFICIDGMMERRQLEELLAKSAK